MSSIDSIKQGLVIYDFLTYKSHSRKKLSETTAKNTKKMGMILKAIDGGLSQSEKAIFLELKEQVNDYDNDKDLEKVLNKLEKRSDLSVESRRKIKEALVVYDFLCYKSDARKKLPETTAKNTKTQGMVLKAVGKGLNQTGYLVVKELGSQELLLYESDDDLDILLDKEVLIQDKLCEKEKSQCIEKPEPSSLSPLSLMLPYFDNWKNTFLKTFSDGSAIVIDPSQGKKAVSEGFGYGLTLAVKFNDQKTFDALLKGYKKNTENRKDGLSAWLMDSNGKIKDKNNGIDADIDTALALLNAHIKWGKEEYKSYAMTLIDAIGEKALKKVGNEIYLLPSADTHLFTKGKDYILNPSYFNMTAFRKFAKVDPTHDWDGLIKTSYKIIEKSIKQFGFTPDWVGVKSKSGGVFELTDKYCKKNHLFSPNQRVHVFGNDAVRVLWHLSLDYKKSKNSKAGKILKDILSKVDPYGTKVADAWSKNDAWHNEIVVSAYALAAKSIGFKKAYQFEDEFSTFQKENYYGTWSGAKDFYYNQTVALIMHYLLLDN